MNNVQGNFPSNLRDLASLDLHRNKLEGRISTVVGGVVIFVADPLCCTLTGHWILRLTQTLLKTLMIRKIRSL